jgi:hypothetical protein
MPAHCPNKLLAFHYAGLPDRYPASPLACQPLACQPLAGNSSGLPDRCLPRPLACQTADLLGSRNSSPLDCQAAGLPKCTPG